MEYTQWGKQITVSAILCACLNPCCNGIYSMRILFASTQDKALVLILVVMEYTQWADALAQFNTDNNVVLILVVMEYTQWACSGRRPHHHLCLNPCCNGIYSMSCIGMFSCANRRVLILVVMEYTQWEQRLTYPLYKAFWFIISMTAIVI